MLLVIFGAGASYDSVPHRRPRSNSSVEEDRPPLANELFGDRNEFVRVMEMFSNCRELIPMLRVDGVVVERELAKIQEQAKTFPKAHQELMAIRFYLQVALWNCQKRWYGHHRGITNYATLLREIERWRFTTNEQVCLVSFNYDTILEQSMSQVLHWAIPDMRAYISSSNYALIKLHGSLNWGLEVEVSNPNSYGHERMILDAATLRISDRYVLLNTTFEAITGRVPALAIPADKKDEFSCPETHLRKLEEMLPHVNKIVIVGWRGTEANFIDILRSKLDGVLDLMIVSGDANGVEETYANFPHRNLRYAGQNRIGVGFTGLIQNLDLLHAFLGC